MTSGFDAADFADATSGEAERLLDGTKLARPAPINRRSPGGEWDWWYALPESERRWLARDYMADRGTDPTDAARWAGFGDDVDAWASRWLDSARSEQRKRARGAAAHARTHLDPLSDEYAAEWEAFDAEQLRAAAGTVYGPQELAAMLGVQVATVHQRRHRGKLPAPDLVISGVPLWHAQTLELEGIL